MLKRILITFFFGMAALMVLTLSVNTASTSTSGSPGNRTGSPGDNNQTCRSCHAGAAPVFKAEILSSDIPASGYVPGSTYTITVAVTASGKSKFGFEATAENTNKQAKGKFIVVNTAQTRTLISSTSITHTTSGTAGSAGSKSWTFKWEAPAAGTGNITFYAAVNATNNNGSDSGDDIYTSSLTVKENTGSSIEATSNPAPFRLFPNPATDRITVEVQNAADVYHLYHLDGRIAKANLRREYSDKLDIDLTGFPAGIYFLVRNSSEGQQVVRFQKL